MQRKLHIKCNLFEKIPTFANADILMDREACIPLGCPWRRVIMFEIWSFIIIFILITHGTYKYIAAYLVVSNISSTRTNQSFLILSSSAFLRPLLTDLASLFSSRQLQMAYNALLHTQRGNPAISPGYRFSIAHQIPGLFRII